MYLFSLKQNNNVKKMRKSKPNVHSINSISQKNARSEQRGVELTVRTVEVFVAQSLAHCKQPTQHSEVCMIHVQCLVAMALSSLRLC